jgi:hypothetical protein
MTLQEKIAYETLVEVQMMHNTLLMFWRSKAYPNATERREEEVHDHRKRVMDEIMNIAEGEDKDA